MAVIIISNPNPTRNQKTVRQVPPRATIGASPPESHHDRHHLGQQVALGDVHDDRPGDHRRKATAEALHHSEHD